MPARALTRRELLLAGGATVIGAAAGGLGVAGVLARGEAQAPAEPAKPVTFESWLRGRQVPYYIGHRGAGDIAPEHTVPSYEAAMAMGAQALEVSVVRSSDNVLYCLHDLTLDRTTTLRGPAAQQPAKVLDTARVVVPRLGPQWVGASMPPMPRLDTVLDAVRGRAVVCIEPKIDDAFPLLLKILAERGMQDSAMIKLHGPSPRLAAAKKSGYPVFAYLGNPTETTPAAIETLARKLDPNRDALVLPAQGQGGLISSDLVRRGVDTGIPVWLFPVHRRFEARQFARLGAEGLITPDIGYLTESVKPAATDDWTTGRMPSGQLTRDPYSNAFALDWSEEGTIGLGFPDRQSFVTLGQFAPIAADSYRIVFDASFDPLPSDGWHHVSLAFGHRDDRYYEHRLGDGDGYHVLLRGDGGMGIYAHVTGDQNGKLLKDAASSPLKAGVWSRLTLDVTPDLIRWSRDDGTSLEVRDSQFRGGYFHVGRSSNDGMLRIRNLSVA